MQLLVRSKMSVMMNISLYQRRSLAPGAMLFMCSLSVTPQHWLMLWRLTRSHYQLTRACANPSSAGTAVPTAPQFVSPHSTSLSVSSLFKRLLLLLLLLWLHFNLCSRRRLPGFLLLPRSISRSHSLLCPVPELCSLQLIWRGSSAFCWISVLYVACEWGEFCVDP